MGLSPTMIDRPDLICDIAWHGTTCIVKTLIEGAPNAFDTHVYPSDSRPPFREDRVCRAVAGACRRAWRGGPNHTGPSN